jgi:hypothetical protein
MTTTVRSKRRDPRRGSAMVVTMIIVSALLAGATVLASMQIASTQSSNIAREGTWSTYCAEAGLAAAQSVVAANYASWAASLTAYCTPSCASPTTTEPSWLYSAIGSHDLDGDGVDDFAVYIKDNDDEQPPATNNLAVDNDLRVFIVSTCIHFSDVQQQVEALVYYNGGGTCYKSQLGGCGGNGNQN